MPRAPACCCLLQVGKKNRSVGATLMNQDSSRSHSVFTITIECIEQGATSVSSYLAWQLLVMVEEALNQLGAALSQ